MSQFCGNRSSQGYEILIYTPSFFTGIDSIMKFHKKIIKVTIHDVEINHFFSYNNNWYDTK